MKKLSVVFITDDEYITPTSTAIFSLLQNKSSDTFIDVYVIVSDISFSDVRVYIDQYFKHLKQKLLRSLQSIFQLRNIDIFISLTMTAYMLLLHLQCLNLIYLLYYQNSIKFYI